MLLAAETQDPSIREAYADFDPTTTSVNAPPTLPDGQSWSAVRGRLGYADVGALRTKPGRPDSPPAISHACSDKIALWYRLGCTGALLDHVLEPIFISSLVVGSELDAAGQARHRTELERALWTRTESSGARHDVLDAADRAGLPGHRPVIAHTSLAYPHAKRDAEAVAASESALTR